MQVCVHGYVSAEPRDAAAADARSGREVNSQRLFTSERSKADASAPSEGQALNTREHIQMQAPFPPYQPGAIHKGGKDSVSYK